MRLRSSPFRAPILLAALLVVGGVGYAAYSSTASVTVTTNVAAFAIVYTAFTDPGAPPNILTFAPSALPSAHPTLSIESLLPGQTIYIYYTVEDIGTIGATGVTEQAVELFTNCDGDLALAQVGSAPTTLSPMVPATAVFSITDTAGAGPAPPGCPDPFTAVWTFSVSGHPV
jgi:hypothetical protein